MIRSRTIQAMLTVASFIVALHARQVAANPDFADAWNWALPPRLHGTLSQDERTQFARAEKLLKEGAHDAAAVEFEKFIAQSGGSPVRAHALLLLGYSQHLGRKRNAAIARYTELLDSYAEAIDQAVPAAFLLGWAHHQNGNRETAIRTWTDLVANERYLEHPLADRTLLELAAHESALKDLRKAEGYWERIIDLFVNAFVRPPGSALEAHSQLTRLYIREGRYPALDSLLAKPLDYVKEGPPFARADYVYRHADEVIKSLAPDLQHRFFAWFRERQADYERARRLDEYFEKTMQLALRINAREDWNAAATRLLKYTEDQSAATLAAAAERTARQFTAAHKAGLDIQAFWQPFTVSVTTRGGAMNSGGQIALYSGVLNAMPREAFADGSPAILFWDTLVARMVDLYAAMLNPERDNGLATVIDRLVRAGCHANAHRIVERMETVPYGMMKKAEIHIAASAFGEAAETCEGIEASDTGRYATWALETRAGLYANRLGRYTDAITLYRTINDPPRTLWAIVDCQVKAGANEDAVATCTEIENFFPDDAPQAAYRKAMIWHDAKDRERAIAAFRAVLRKYPRHAVAAQAHQMQEKYGFDFGGGVIDENR